MSLIGYNRNRVAQPQTVASINWANPITRGIQYASNTNDRVITVLGNNNQRTLVAPNSNSLNLGFDSAGRTISLASGIVYETGLGVNTSVNPSSISVMALAKFNAGITGSRGLITRGVDGYGNGWNFFLGAAHATLGTANAQVSLVYTNNGTAGYGTAGTINIYNRWVVIIAVCEPNNFRHYVDGKLDATTNVTNSGFRTSTKGWAISRYVADGQSADLNWAGNLAMWSTWNRTLSTTEITSLTTNPWQIFAGYKTNMSPYIQIINYGYSYPTSDVSNSNWTRVPIL